MDPLTPSAPDYFLSTADLARVHVGPLEAARIIMQQTRGGAAPPDTLSLLASLVKTQSRSNVRANIFAFSVSGDGVNGEIQQILPENSLRQSLIITTRIQTGAGEFILLQPGPLNKQALSPADFEIYSALAITGWATNLADGVLEFFHTPTNAVTVGCNNTLGSFSGIIIEGT